MRQARFIKTTICLGAFLTLCIIFYHALIHSTDQYRDVPVGVANRESQKNDKVLKYQKTEKPSEMDILYDRSVKWAAQSRTQKISTLLENPVYERFHIKKKRKKEGGKIVEIPKKKIDVLIIVSSGPRHSDRRQGIRDTWWKHCVPTSGVKPKCWFFTDLLGPSHKFYKNVTAEQEKYQDMRYQPLGGGIEFGIRFLYHLVWAMTRYDFKYFIRIDDDYFLCLQRLLKELPVSPPLQNFHWGYTHCIHEMIRPEESIIMLSRDLVERFLLQDPLEIRCHPWADQMLGVWVTNMNILTLFRHDDRIHHAPIVERAPYLRYKKNLCYYNIAIHGTYPKDMRLFWKQRGDDIKEFASTKERDEKIGNVMINSVECEKPHNFNYLLFEPEWQYEPKRCLYKPKWDTGKQGTIDGVYDGRQENKRLANEDVESNVGMN